MRKFEVITPYGTVYQIDEDGCFLKYGQHKWEHPHESWKCTGCAQLLPFGNIRRHSLTGFIRLIEQGHKFTFKNGKPRYTLTDLDYGTHRIHGNTKHHGIKYAYEV